MSFLFIRIITCSFVGCEDHIVRLLQLRGQRGDANVVVLAAHGVVAPSSAVIQATASSNSSTIGTIPRGLAALIPARRAGIGLHDVPVVFVEKVLMERVPSPGSHRTCDYRSGSDFSNSLDYPPGPGSEESLEPPGNGCEKTSSMQPCLGEGYSCG